MMRIRKILIVLTVTVSAASCANYYETVMKSSDVDMKYEAAFHYFNRGKYKKAADIFENLRLLCQGTPQEDTVQYYNALSNYKYGDFVTAESNFSHFIEVFPRSPFTKEAEYLRIQCLYDATYRYELDPTPTRKAMVVITEYMYDNPGSEYFDECEAILKDLQGRLDRKNYESARLYYTMEDYKAASYALKNVLRENAENVYREYIMYYIAMSSYKFALNSVSEKQPERYLVFMDEYYNFISEYPESPLRKGLDVYFEKAQKFSHRKGIDRETVEEDEMKDTDLKKQEKNVRKAEKGVGVSDQSGRVITKSEPKLSKEEKLKRKQDRKEEKAAEKESNKKEETVRKTERKKAGKTSDVSENDK